MKPAAKLFLLIHALALICGAVFGFRKAVQPRLPAVVIGLKMKPA